MNPASRLLNFVEDAQRHDIPGVQANVQWAQIFLKKKANPNSEELHSISQRLDSIQNQLNDLAQTLNELSLPGNLYLQPIAQLKSATSAGSLNKQWDQIRGAFSGENVMALRWAAHTIGMTEAPASDDELKQFNEHLEAMRATLESGKLPRSLRQMIKRQLDSMNAALADYSISGIAPLRQSLNAAMGEFTLEKETIAAAVATATDEEKRGIQKHFDTIKRGADLVEKTAKVAGAGQQLLGYANKAVEALAGFF
ncbi:hypothetical protein [Achromobacter sp. JUb104]|uniref:hypothetical protein n=1 Tax=Achromobacter sp. JUb104 TaxID=2940590 RepID=UPI002168EB1E|nr:hypothetical protein [Achromobacter sp. JUb104]MCS3505005.1 methyl-accepting chemotaxis protein [Achromobacter sp. JUb104]